MLPRQESTAEQKVYISTSVGKLSFLGMTAKHAPAGVIGRATSTGGDNQFNPIAGYLYRKHLRFQIQCRGLHPGKIDHRIWRKDGLLARTRPIASPAIAATQIFIVLLLPNTWPIEY
jgi:hypothetical protein